MASPFSNLVTRPPADAPPARPVRRRTAPAVPSDPDALYHRLLTLAATSRDRGQFVQQHRDELAQLRPQVRSVVIRAAGMGVPEETVKKALSPDSYLNKQIRKAAEDVKGIPGGLVHAAGAVVHDVADTATGHPTLKRTLKVAEETGKGVVETVKHPGRDLFQTATLGAAALSAGAGLAGRAGAVAKAASGAAEAGDLASAVGKLSKADARAYSTLANPEKHLADVDELTARRIATPSPALGRVLDLDPHLAAVRTEVVKKLGDETIKPRKPGPVAKAREAGASKPAQIVKAAVKTPAPKQRTLTVPGEGGKPAIVVHPVASKNLAANLVERKVLDPLRQRALNKAAPAREFTSPTVQKAGEAVQRLGSATSKVGRELRAQRAVRDALELAPVSRLERFAPSAPARGLTRVTGGRVNVPTVLPRRLGGERLSAAEQKAVDIAASGTNPGKVADYHENLIARGVGDVRAHRVQIALARAAGPHFNDLMAGEAPKLAQAVEETRAVIRKGEQLKGMSPEEIAHRVGARKADIEAIAADKESPLEELFHKDTTPERAQQIHEAIVATGKQAIDEGAFYLPSTDKAGFFRSKVPATKQPGDYGLGPQGAHPALRHPFTGALQRSGRARSDATRLAAQSYKQAQRYATIERGFSQLKVAARDTPEEAGGHFAIPIRATVSIPAGLKRAVQKADIGELTRQDVKYLKQEDLEAFIKELFPEDPNLPGVKWIDSRLLGGLKGQGASFGGQAGAVIDALNSPFRAGLLYTKPSYALNLVQALGTNVIQQGVFTPVNLRAALTLGKKLGAEDQHAVFSLMGQGRSRGYEAVGGLGKNAINAAGEFWNAIVDRYPRVASWLHEARREGYTTPEQIHALLNDERFADKLIEITRRANKEAIEFGQLSPFEQQALRRFLFFYPWMRGATLYSLRFPKEHPVQAAAMAQLGGQGHERSVEAFGPFVDYGPGTAGLVPVGAGRGANLSNLNTFSTPVEAIEAIADPSLIPRQLGPAAGAAYTAISKKTPLGVQLPATKNSYVAGAQQLTDLIPFVQALNRSKIRPADKVIKEPVFPKGPQAALERYVGGSAFPQPVNKPALAAKGEKAFRERLDPERKARYDAAKTLRQAQQDAAALHRAGVLKASGLPPSVRQALELDRKRKLGYVKAAKDAGVSLTNLPVADKAAVVAKIVAEAHTASPQVVANFERLVAMAPPEKRASVVAAFWRVYGKGEALSSWRGYVTTNKRQR